MSCVELLFSLESRQKVSPVFCSYPPLIELLREVCKVVFPSHGAVTCVARGSGKIE